MGHPRRLLLKFGQRPLPALLHRLHPAASNGHDSDADRRGEQGVEEAVDDRRRDLELVEGGEHTNHQHEAAGERAQRLAVGESADSGNDHLSHCCSDGCSKHDDDDGREETGEVPDDACE